MFYSNLKPRKKSIQAKVTFTNFQKCMNALTDEELLPFKQAKISYNFNVKNGALKTGLGFKELSLPKYNESGERTILMPGEPIKKAWVYKYFSQNYEVYDPELLFMGESGQMYFVTIHDDTPFSFQIPHDNKFTSVPNAVNYRLNNNDIMLFSSATDGMWKHALNEGIVNIPNAPHIISMCVHYERLFAVCAGERTRLAFSANLDPTDWSLDLTSGGYIDMKDERGGLNKVVSFNDYLYVFRDYGVSRVSAYGDQSEFSVSHLFVSSVKLYGNTVCVCGNKIMLLARDGIHIFDGYSTKKLNLGFNELFKNVENDNACSVYYKNKFYLACRLDFNDGEEIGCEAFDGGYINNALIEYDLTTGEVSITRGCDISSLLVIDDEKMSKIAVCFNGEHSNKIGEITEDGCMFKQPLPKMWLSPKSNMGYPTKIKKIKDCLIKSTSDCILKIITDKEQKEFFVQGKPVAQRVKINLSGEEMQVAFKSNAPSNIQISCPQISLSITE